MAQRSSDGTIAQNVRRAMDSDSLLHAGAVSVQVRRGVVTLTGTVGRYRDRMGATAAASRVPGVAEVRNQLQVVPDRVRDASEIAADLEKALASDPRVNPTGIVVEVAEGVVRLSGAVSSLEERRAAEEAAWHIDGVVDVSSDMTVSPDRRRPDSEIEADVRSALDEDANLSDPALITVKSVAGTVRLEGTVSSAREREAAEKDAWYTAGVVYVENRLSAMGEREGPAAA